MWGSKQTVSYCTMEVLFIFECFITELVQRKLFTNSNIRWTSYSQRTCPRIVSASTPLRFLDSWTRQQTFLSSKCVCNLSSFQHMVCQLFVVYWPLCSVPTCAYSKNGPTFLKGRRDSFSREFNFAFSRVVTSSDFANAFTRENAKLKTRSLCFPTCTFVDETKYSIQHAAFRRWCCLEP